MFRRYFRRRLSGERAAVFARRFVEDTSMNHGAATRPMTRGCTRTTGRRPAGARTFLVNLLLRHLAHWRVPLPSGSFPIEVSRQKTLCVPAYVRDGYLLPGKAVANSARAGDSSPGRAWMDSSSD